MLKVKLQYFGHLMWRTDSLENTLMLEKVEGGRRRGWGWDDWMTLMTRWTWVWVNSGSWWWTGRRGVLQCRGCRVRHDWVTELNWCNSLHLLNPIHPYPTTHLATTGLFSMSVSLFHGHVHLCHVLDSTYKWCHICPSLSDLLHLVWQSLSPSMLLQMVWFHSFFKTE